MWRSSVARTLGVGEVQGSNPCIPTITVTLQYDFDSLNGQQDHLLQM